MPLQAPSDWPAVLGGAARLLLCSAGLLQVRGRRRHGTLPRGLGAAGESSKAPRSSPRSMSSPSQDLSASASPPYSNDLTVLGSLFFSGSGFSEVADWNDSVVSDRDSRASVRSSSSRLTCLLNTRRRIIEVGAEEKCCRLRSDPAEVILSSANRSPRPVVTWTVGWIYFY